VSVQQHWLVAWPSFTIGIIFFLGFSTSIIYWYLSNLKDPSGFVQFYLLSISVKMLSGFALIILVFFEDKPGIALNAGLFLVGYSLFTAVEIILLRKLIRKKNF
jgi:hypothetical protein